MIRFTGLLLALFVAGCATTHYVAMSSITAEDVARNVGDQSRSVQVFTSSGYGDFESPQGEYSARFDISIHKPSTTSVRIYGPFGMKVAQAKLSSDTLLVYNSLNNEVFVGKPTEANLRHFLVVAGDGASLSDLLLGLMAPLTHLGGAQASSRFEGGHVSFVYSSRDTVEQFTVNEEYMRTIKYEKVIDGETTIRISYSDFTSVNNIYFPRAVSFEDFKHNISAKLYYQDIALNEKDEVQITVPADAREIFLN
jgi:hypothetical protein